MRFVRLRSLATGEQFADPELRAKLLEEATAERSSITAVAVRLLCTIYGVKYTPTGRTSHASEKSDILNLRIPDTLDRALAVSAAKHGRRVQAEIVHALSDHYGLDVPARGTAVAA